MEELNREKSESKMLHIHTQISQKEIIFGLKKDGQDEREREDLVTLGGRDKK